MKTTNPCARQLGALTVALSIFAGLTFAQAAAPDLASQTPLDLDANPSFDFAPDPGTDPLFTPELFDLTGDAAGFAGLDAVRTFAGEVGETFPPGMEVFVAYWGNPGYALLAGTAMPPSAARRGQSAFSGLRLPARRRTAGLWRPPVCRHGRRAEPGDGCWPTL